MANMFMYVLALGLELYTQAIYDALSVIFTVEGIILLVLGSLLGLLFGILPGLGGAVGLALLIPITFDLDPLTAFMILAAANGGAAFGGSITAILLNVPGTAVNAATLLDGYPLTKKGEANYALGASATASAVGAFIGLIFLVITLPFLRSILRLFGPPEFFAMAIFGLSIIGVATKQSFLNGIISGFIGLALGLVGYNTITGGARYTYDTVYLTDGIQLLVVIIGLFAIGEMIDLYVKGETISSKSIESGGKVMDGVKSVLTHWKLTIQCSLVGVIIGLVPAAGGAVANVVSYIFGVQTSKNPEKFGTGDIRGVIASESANDSKDGGAAIPTVAFGIPGSAAWAVLLGAFTLHGITPGPNLLIENLDVVFIIIFSLLISNVTTSIAGILLADQLAKITIVPIDILAPMVFVVSLVGTYTLRFNILDVVLASVIGIFGYFMIRLDFSRIALIIGLILGPLAEDSFSQSLQISRGSIDIFYTRPMTAIIFLITILVITLPIYRATKGKK